MTDHVRMPDLADMAEAARLTRNGRPEEATALILRSLGGGAAPHAPGAAPTRAGPSPEAHATLIPEKVREAVNDALGQVARGLRGLGPSLRGFGGLHETPRHDEPDREPPAGPESGEGAFVERSFSNAAGARDYKLFIPCKAGREGPRPLVVMLHGCTQSPDDFAAGTRMNALAEEDGVYVAYPRQSRRANAQKCWNWFEPGDQGRERGEAGIVAGLTRALIAEHDIDPARVYIAGLSAGGAAAANIARAYPDLYAGVGVHSGLAAGCAQDLPSALMAMRTGAPGATTAAGFGPGAQAGPTRVPTIVFHGSGDDTVSPRNGEAVLAQAGVADLTPSRTGGSTPGGHRYTRTRYADAAGQVQVESWQVEGAGHAWQGGSPQGSYTDPRGPDASRAMLDFFAEHRLGRSLRS